MLEICWLTMEDSCSHCSSLSWAELAVRAHRELPSPILAAGFNTHPDILEVAMYKAEGKAPRKGFVSQICHCFNGWHFATLYSLINYLLRAASWAIRKHFKCYQENTCFCTTLSITKTKKQRLVYRILQILKMKMEKTSENLLISQQFINYIERTRYWMLNVFP